MASIVHSSGTIQYEKEKSVWTLDKLREYFHFCQIEDRGWLHLTLYGQPKKVQGTIWSSKSAFNSVAYGVVVVRAALEL